MHEAELSPNDTRPQEPVKADPFVGQLIEKKYKIEKLIGEGGMGKVYKGLNVRTESPVAIKTLIPELVTDESLVKRFEIEAKAASNLRHPNTIRIYDFGEHEGVLFMVMELLNGDSMEGVLRKERRLDPSRLIRIMEMACRSLAEAHEQGLVHRDLKPDNIFLNQIGGEKDFVKVLDFGVAKLKDKKYGSATLTQAGMIFGTPRYMSPEQARAFDIDGRSDLYALGVIMYEALTGVPPFDARDPVAILVMHVNEPPKPFAEVAPDLPPMPDFEAVVMRCLRKAPEERYDDIEALLRELNRLAAIHRGEVPSTGPTTPVSGPDRTKGGATVAMDDSGSTAPNTAVQGAVAEDSDAFDALGIGDKRDPTFALGDRTIQLTDSREVVKQKSPLPIIVAIAVVVVGAGAALLAFILNTAPDEETVPDEAGQDEVAASEESESEEPAAPIVPPETGTAIAIGLERTGTALAGATVFANESVVQIALVEENGVEASASVSDRELDPITLPGTFTLVHPADEEAEEITIVVEADGYRSHEMTIALAPTEEPISVRLRRPSSSSSSSSSSEDEGGDTVTSDGPEGGLADPYAIGP